MTETNFGSFKQRCGAGAGAKKILWLGAGAGAGVNHFKNVGAGVILIHFIASSIALVKKLLLFI